MKHLYYILSLLLLTSCATIKPGKPSTVNQDKLNNEEKKVESTIDELDTAYQGLNDYKMLSDNIVLNSVTFKPLFGEKAAAELRATIKVIRASNSTASISEIKTAVVASMNNYFSIDNWNFGDTFYFTELSAYIHSNLSDFVSSVVLVPNDPSMTFGDLYEIRSAPNEIFVSAVQTSDIQVITSLTSNEFQNSGQ